MEEEEEIEEGRRDLARTASASSSSGSGGESVSSDLGSGYHFASEWEEIPSFRWMSPSFRSNHPPIPPGSGSSSSEAKPRPVVADAWRDWLPALTRGWRRGQRRRKEGPEVSSILGRAGIVGPEKAVDVLDTLGSSMSNLNSGSGLFSGTVHRGNKISILAFEVANTIAKGATLMQSLSEENVHLLKNDILQSDGVRQLVSTDIKELLSIVAADKREEFDVFSKEIVRFGDLCKDPQWHHLSRYFQKWDWDPTPQHKLKEEADTMMQHLVILERHTYELYHELHALDRFEQDYWRKLQEEESLPTARRGKYLMILHGELKHQRKHVKSLKKKSLWSRNLQEVVKKLVTIVIFLHKGILEAFGHTGNNINCKPDHTPQRLGVLGLSLHYANITNQINNIVSQPIALPPNARDTLYHGLPATVKAALRLRLQSFSVKEELTVALIKSEMQRILQWLVPMADNTVKAHQGFGWVGEWANMSTELNKRPVQQSCVIRIQTLHHADREKTEEYILQLAVWLHRLVNQVKNRGFGFKTLKSIQCPSRKNTLLSINTKQDLSLACNDKSPKNPKIPIVIQLSEEEKRGGRRRAQSSGNSPSRELASGVDFCPKRTKLLDIIDGLGTLTLDSPCPKSDSPCLMSSFHA